MTSDDLGRSGLRVGWAVAVLACVLAGLAGCGGSSSAGATAPKSSKSSADTLTGFGATAAGFASAHQADPDPQLAHGCCFLPTVHNSGSQEPIDRYNVAGDVDYMTDETVAFDTGTSQAAAQAVVAKELPGDARPVKTRKARACLTVIYRSRMLARNLPAGFAPYLSVSYYGTFDGPYDPRNVNQAIILATGKFLQC